MNYREIEPGVYWIGALDPGLRVFDVIMRTEWGTTYNSYLIKGKEKTALIELVKEPFTKGYIDTIRQLADPKDIDYIILNHTEPDHSGALEYILKEAPNATIIGSRIGLNLAKEIANQDFPEMVVKDKDFIDLGGKTLNFISAPFLHWPDSMFTYLEEDAILFSGDVFGCHYCTQVDTIFNDELKVDILPAQRYYFDVIMSPFKNYMLEAIEKIRGLNIEKVAPSHGPVLRDKPWDTINLMEDWSKDVHEVNDPPKIFIGYVSAYGNTTKIGEAIAQGIKEYGNFDVEMVDVSENPLPDTISKIDKADALLLGSPTINRDALEPVWRVMSNISLFKNKGKLAAGFGSYGWSGEAVGAIGDRLKGLQFKVIEPGFKAKLVPTEKTLEEAKEFGVNFVKQLQS